MQLRQSHDQRGSAFILTLILTFIVGGAVGLLLLAASTQSRNSIEGEAHQERLLRSDSGLAKAKALLFNDPHTYHSDVAGTDTAPYTLNTSKTADGVLRISEDNTQVWVLSIANTTSSPTSGPWVYQVTSIATVNGTERTTRMILKIEKEPATVAGAGLGAVVAQGNVKLSGSIGVDGNDHNRIGGLVSSGAIDRPGIVTNNSVVLSSASASVGGNGIPMPGNGMPAGTADEGTSIWDSETDSSNGADDDTDGIIDDAYAGQFPGTLPQADGKEQGAAAFLDWPNGTVTEQDLADAATATGTLFSSYADYATWLSTASAEDAGGKIIYIRFNDPAEGGPALNHELGPPFELPGNMPTSVTDEDIKPSMLVVGRKPNSTTGVISHDLIIKNVHGEFQGLFLFDQIDKVNSGTSIVGSAVAYKAGATHLFGNGNATLSFSSDVLSRLPSADPNAGLVVTNILAWWED